MKESIIFKGTSEHIGQVTIDQADHKIKELEKETNKKWRKDFSDFLDDSAELDEDSKDKLREGHCWIVIDENQTHANT